MIGKTLIHYEITSQIGKGGMGEVYQAKDTKLGRDVAIKVLPEEFARDHDRVARFQREAKLLASLNHPNIAAIHGLEESEGTHFLVMELIEGETLKDRIKSGPIPVEEALQLALQMAEALEAAHENGVIHRDLKPANIKVTPDGKVKVLDFGLAKAYAGEQGNVSLADSPTISAAATQQGVILGTAAYMSPEQAKGKPVDKRADIWAFGVVLFEMLTGKSLFSGEDVSSTLARVLEREPDFSTLPQKLHSRILFMLERCLKKDPKDRYSGISDARVDIQSVLADTSGLFVQPSTGLELQKRTGTTITWVAVVVLTALIVGGIIWNLRTPEPRQVIPYDYELPEGQQFPIVGPPLGVSPDGKQIVYCTTEGLYLKPVNELNAKLIPGSDERSEGPFFSPDGTSIAYFSIIDSKLKKISIGGGAPTNLCDVEDFRGGSWHRDGSIVYSSLQNGIMRVASKGGTPEILIEKTSENLFNPQVLPDGKSILYTVGQGQPRVVIKSFESDEPKELFAGWFLRYLPSGHIIYWDYEDNLCAVRFDTDRIDEIGENVPMVPNVDEAAVSDSGTLIYTTQGPQESDPQYTLVWVNREGEEEPLEAEPNQYDAPNISPDGKQVAVTIGGLGNNDIWVWHLERKTLNKLTREETNEIMPVWTPDSKRIIYFSDHEDYGIYWRQADGAGKAEKLISQPDNQLFPGSISIDGKVLLISELAAWTNADIGMLTMEGEYEKKLLLQDEYNESQPQISPDVKWIAYTSDESGNNEVFVRSFPEVGKRKLQVSNGGGLCPLWSPDGKELYYLSADNHVMVVSVKTEPTFDLGTPETLFRNSNLTHSFGRGYPWDIHPSGDRFLMIKPPAGSGEAAIVTGPRNITIVLNWDVELGERVPVE